MLDSLEEVDLGDSLETSEQLSEEHQQALQRLKVHHSISNINKKIWSFIVIKSIINHCGMYHISTFLQRKHLRI